jgi:serine protease Do
MKGEVVGITTAKYSGATASGATIEGLGFAIPIADVQAVLGDLREHGYVTGQAYLGVMVYTVQTTMGNIGCCVESTTPDGAADRAGIQAGDIITGIDDYEITSLEEMTMVLAKYKAGDTVKVTVLRNWRTVELTLTFDEKTQE